MTPGQQFGRYVIRARLGAGGMGEVFLADDTQLGRRVALKLLPPETEADPLARRRLLREAQAAATLDHPHICSVYEVGEADGRQYIAMQYVEGETLDARMSRTPLDLPDILASAVQIADAVSEAHAQGILHRDIKPANIMVTTRGDAKVMDFGLAKQVAADSGSPVAETASAIEPARRGRRNDGIHVARAGARRAARSAQRSLQLRRAAVQDGRRPAAIPGSQHGRGDGGDSHARAVSPRAICPEIPSELERIVTKLLKKQPDNRYQTAKDLLIDLRTLKEEQEFQLRLGRTPPPPASVR